MAETDLRDCLRPAPPDLEPALRRKLCADIADGKLREAVIANTRFRERLFGRLLLSCGLPGDDDMPMPDEADLARLKIVFEMKGDALRQTMGLAWFSDPLARMVLERTLPPALQDLDLATIRPALRYRGVAGAVTVPDPFTLADVMSAGETLIDHWVWSLPMGLAGRVALATGRMSREVVPDATRVSLAARVLGDLAVANRKENEK